MCYGIFKEQDRKSTAYGKLHENVALKSLFIHSGIGINRAIHSIRSGITEPVSLSPLFQEFLSSHPTEY